CRQTPPLSFGAGEKTRVHVLLRSCVAGDDFTVAPEQPLARLVDVPVFVGGKRLGCYDRNHVLVAGDCLKINIEVGILEACCAKRSASGDMGEFGAAIAKQVLAIAQQAVKYAKALIVLAGSYQIGQKLLPVNWFGVALANAVEHVAKSCLAISVANRGVVAELWLEICKLAVVGKAPVAPPEVAHKRVSVGQLDRADIGLANMPDNYLAFDGITLHQTGNFRIDAGFGIVKQAQPLALIK